MESRLDNRLGSRPSKKPHTEEGQNGCRHLYRTAAQAKQSGSCSSQAFSAGPGGNLLRDQQAFMLTSWTSLFQLSSCARYGTSHLPLRNLASCASSCRPQECAEQAAQTPPSVHWAGCRHQERQTAAAGDRRQPSDHVLRKTKERCKPGGCFRHSRLDVGEHALINGSVRFDAPQMANSVFLKGPQDVQCAPSPQPGANLYHHLGLFRRPRMASVKIRRSVSFNWPSMG